MIQNTEPPVQPDDEVADAASETMEKDIIDLFHESDVEIELDHFRLVGLPEEPAEVNYANPQLALALALLSEIIEIKRAVMGLADAVVEDRKRIRRMERQANGPGMGGGMGLGLMPTPLARATANGEPDPEHLKAPPPAAPIDLTLVRATVQEDNDE
jgi:hypothetical protein